MAADRGTDVREACKQMITEELEAGRSVNAMRVLGYMTYLTDQIDLTKNPMRAKFAN